MWFPSPVGPLLLVQVSRLQGGLLGTWLHFASHPHALPYDLPTIHLEITHEHISYTNSVCKGQAGPSSSPPEERQTYCQGQSVSLQLGWPKDRPRVLCSGAQTTSVATVSLCAQSALLWAARVHTSGERRVELSGGTSHAQPLITKSFCKPSITIALSGSSRIVSVPRSASLFLGEDRKRVAEQHMLPF